MNPFCSSSRPLRRTALSWVASTVAKILKSTFRRDRCLQDSRVVGCFPFFNKSEIVNLLKSGWKGQTLGSNRTKIYTSYNRMAEEASRCCLGGTAQSPLKPFFTHDFMLTEFWSDLWSNGWCSVCFHLQSVRDFIRSIVTDIKVSGSGADECSFYQLHLWNWRY